MANSKRKCAYCKKRVSNYIVFGVQAFCDIEHATKYAYEKKDKGKARIEKEQRKKDRIRKEALKTAGDYTKEAQASINKYVRIRDKFKSCISCPSESVEVDGGYIGAGGWDAGHYRSRGSASHLRFNLNNIHKQCVKCNRFNSGNAVDYRIKLIDRIGLDKVNQLESDNEPRKFTIDYLKRIKKIFNKKARLYEKKFR